jgi:probable rRNA maturation factor
MSEGRITLVVEDPNWRRSRGLPDKLMAAAKAALKAGASARAGATAKNRLPRVARFTILLADDARLRDLNNNFRGKDRPTNVLSFPAAANDDGHVGDIAMAYGVTRAEAKAAGKSIADHASHLVVHGVLHLAGFDHEKPRDAEKMESLEVKILSRLGIADPYAVTHG